MIAAYGASKAALIRLTEELAWQLGPAIRVNAVAPAVVKTKFADRALRRGRGEGQRGVPDEAPREPGGRRRAWSGFLVSDDAAWITGETVRVDGGILATGGLGSA